MIKNNDILRRVRYALDIKDYTMMNIFKLGGLELSKEEVVNILKKEEEEGFLKCTNSMLDAFLDGLIINKRGKQEPKPGQEPQVTKINKNNKNNVIMRKLRIALSFKSDDMLRVMKLGGVTMSSSELSAIFRREDHKNYRECGDSYVRNFLKGLIAYYRG